MESSEVHTVYRESIPSDLPKELCFLVEEVNFSDYTIEQWIVDEIAHTLRLRIRGEMVENIYDVRWFEITYTGVSEIRFDQEQVEPREVASTEAERINTRETVYAFRWGFVDGATRIVRFRAVTFRYLEQPEPERAAIQAGILYAEGQKALASNDYSLAATKFTASLKSAPDHTTTKFLLAKSRFYLGEYAAAQSLLQEILAEQPKHSGALNYQKRIREAGMP